MSAWGALGFRDRPSQEMIAGRLGCQNRGCSAHTGSGLRVKAAARRGGAFRIPHPWKRAGNGKRSAFLRTALSTIPIRRAGGCRFRGHWCGQTHPVMDGRSTWLSAARRCRIGLVMVQQLADEQRIPNIAPDKNMLGIPIKETPNYRCCRNRCELVEVDDPLPRSAPGQHIAGTDKPRASGYKNCLHSDTFQTRLGNTSNARNGLVPR